MGKPSQNQATVKTALYRLSRLKSIRQFDSPPRRLYSLGIKTAGYTMARFKTAPLFLTVTWLAIVLAGVISGDLVVDLSFESSALSDVSGAEPISEEPDNSAEHVLMPSPAGDSSAGATPLQLITQFDATGISPKPSSLSYVSGRSFPASSYASRFRPPSFLLALRI